MQTEVFTKLMNIARENNIIVGFVPFKAHDGMLCCEGDESKIAIRMNLSFDGYIYNLAHELAHYFLHYGKGDITTGEKCAEYEEQADRAAKMLLAALSAGGVR